ncbi:DnaD domain protein [Hazenella sp. IB182357]|uniref:DnaD domain protein n=1 Tax=Polycladospora coralii TaxID=2771432 RepID=A0A926RVH4_9BACL|nr:DnaD domain protein [Polycladospora coralii]MBD1373832.1 DnaD domain protein [Polycladospora coralii]
MKNNDTYYEQLDAELETRAQAAYDNSFNHTLHAHIDIAGDLVAGALLSRILFWFAPDKYGRSKVRIIKDGHYWIAKSRHDWDEEIRISPKQYDRAIKILVEKELVVKKNYKFDGAPTPHMRPNYDMINFRIYEWKAIEKEKILKEIEEEIQSGKRILPKGENPINSTLSAEKVNNIDEKNDQNPSGSWILPKGENGFYPKGKMDFTQRGKSLTGNTTESTSESTSCMYVCSATRFFADNFEIKKHHEESVKSMVKSHGEEFVIESIKRAINKDKQNVLAYAQGVLKNWKEADLKTVEEIEAYEEAYRVEQEAKRKKQAVQGNLRSKTNQKTDKLPKSMQDSNKYEASETPEQIAQTAENQVRIQTILQNQEKERKQKQRKQLSN